MQFHPLAYLLKLSIELGMADLIIKVVRTSRPSVRSSDRYKRSIGTSQGKHAGKVPGDAGQASTIPLSGREPWSVCKITTNVGAGDDADGLETKGNGDAAEVIGTNEVRNDEIVDVVEPTASCSTKRLKKTTWAH